ncbi:MAG: protein translocase subunit SecD [Pyrinomonadaceae bacterium]|nr:protein translocase subunit SecD [Pyrinomonadaceae bacterium]
MNRTGLWIRTGVILAITLVGVYMVFGPRRMPTSADFTWEGIKTNLAENINLGLDLKGGSHLVMRVKLDDYLKTMTENNAQAAVSAIQDSTDPKFQVTNNTTVAENGNYSFNVTLADGTDLSAVAEAVKKKVDLQTWNESTSGSTISWTLGAAAQNVLKVDAVSQAKKIIESRINTYGVKEPTLQNQGSPTSGQILLQMPGVDDPERVKALIGAESNLALMKIVSAANPAPVTTYPSIDAAKASLGGTVPANRKILPYTDRDEQAAAGQTPDQKPPTKYVVVEYPAVVDGSELRNAEAVSRTGAQGDYQITFQFKPSGAQKFGDWTGKNINNYMAVVLNDEVKSAAFIKSQIFDSGEISGKFTKTTAEDLALTLKSGALPAKIVYQEERTVGPSLGADSIRSGVEASLGGLGLVIVFMLFYYRGSGVNAVVALVLNMLLTVAALVLIRSTLTLPGIAGLILGIGMAVDSNVLIFERIREELKAGFDIPTSIDLGFDRAFVTIIDTHITTIISSVILYMAGGAGPIRGFAVTLILGLLINLFTAVFVSRTIFNWELSLRPKMNRLSI